MLFKLSNLNSNLEQTLGYLNPALNNSALDDYKVLFKERCLGLWTAIVWLTVWLLYWLYCK